MASLFITDTFEIEVLGTTYSGQQGDADNGSGSPVEVTVTGLVQRNTGSLATATARTIWDEDADNPVDFDYLWFKSDQACYVQLIGSSTNYVVPVAADVPVRLPGQFLAAANTTPISGSAPSLESVDSIVIQNNSGNTMNYEWAIID